MFKMDGSNVSVMICLLPDSNEMPRIDLLRVIASERAIYTCCEFVSRRLQTKKTMKEPNSTKTTPSRTDNTMTATSTGFFSSAHGLWLHFDGSVYPTFKIIEVTQNCRLNVII